MLAKTGDRRMVLWRAVDDEGEVLDILVQKRRNKAAAKKLLRRLLKNHGVSPESITTDKQPAYGAALREFEFSGRHRPGGMRANNRAKNSHLRSADASANSSGSRAKAQLSGSFHPMQRSTTSLTPSSISSAVQSSGSSASGRSGCGTRRRPLSERGRRFRKIVGRRINVSISFQPPSRNPRKIAAS
jgi:transposase-like protein